MSLKVHYNFIILLKPRLDSLVAIKYFCKASIGIENLNYYFYWSFEAFSNKEVSTDCHRV